MTLKNEIMYTPLVTKYSKIKNQNGEFEGIIMFESKELIHIKNRIDLQIKKILKSSISIFYIFDEELNKFIEINPQLLKGNLVYRLKKMK